MDLQKNGVGELLDVNKEFVSKILPDFKDCQSSEELCNTLKQQAQFYKEESKYMTAL